MVSKAASLVTCCAVTMIKLRGQRVKVWTSWFMPVSAWARIAYPNPNFLQHSVIQRSEAYGSQAFARFREAVKLWVQADACSQKLPAQFKGMAGENFLDSIASVYANGCGLIVVHGEADGGHRVLLRL